MVVPIVEVTGATFARLATERLGYVPYQEGYMPHSGRYVPTDLEYGEWSTPVQRSEAIEVCEDSTEEIGRPAVFHVQPSLHDFFHWSEHFFNFPVAVCDYRREKIIRRNSRK